jgi:rhodanese-related sulfurtransferase
MTLNQKLAAAAVTLGAIGLLARPNADGRVTIDTRSLAAEVGREVDHVDVYELADWIVQGRSDYRLLDIRDESAFAKYHIPTAESVPMTRLIDYPLLCNEKLVIYSDGGIHSAQAWFLLKARGYAGAYILRGGLDEWTDSILFPTFAANPTPFQQQRDARVRALSAHFGGSPRTGGVAEPDAIRAMPQVSAPAVVAPAPKATKKTKEGC